MATEMTNDEAMVVTNRCKQDHERRERAWADSELIDRQGNMERRISFEVGYDHRAFPDDCGGGGHGQHGMNMRFVLVGPLGAVQWLCYMSNWVPGNVRHGHVGGEEPVSLVPSRYPALGDGMAADLGYHSPKPMYDGDDYGPRPCEYLPEGECWYDGSGLNAEPLLEAFLNHGPHAVWVALARYYMQTFGEQRELESGDDEVIDAEIVED